MTRNTFYCALGLAFAACGDAAEATDAPSEAVLCQLELGRTTEIDAVELLGHETVANRAMLFSQLIYQYGGADGIYLRFDTDSVLVEAYTSGLVRLPECWRTAVASSGAGGSAPK